MLGIGRVRLCPEQPFASALSNCRVGPKPQRDRRLDVAWVGQTALSEPLSRKQRNGPEIRRLNLVAETSADGLPYRFLVRTTSRMVALMLYALWYNFVRIHRTLRITPAMAAGVADRLWLEDVLALIDGKSAKVGGGTLVG